MIKTIFLYQDEVKATIDGATNLYNWNRVKIEGVEYRIVSIESHIIQSDSTATYMEQRIYLNLREDTDKFASRYSNPIAALNS